MLILPRHLYWLLLLSIWHLSGYAEEKRDYSAETSQAQQALAKQDYANAYQQYLHLAEHKQNPLAQFNLALFYEFGWGRAVNKASACQWYGKAAQGNIPAAQHFYAECLRHGLQGPAQPAQAAVWYQRAVENGHTISLCSLAELYIDGEGVAQDTQQGLALCHRAAELGISKAQLRMARFYLSKNPKLHNPAQAFQYATQAAGNRNITAQFMLAGMYRDGVGHTADLNAARQWFELAAANGYIPAYYPAGLLYFQTPRDPETQALPAQALAKAYLWLSAAAQRSQNKQELEDSKQLLDNIAEVMPQSWLPDLKAKLKAHLQRYPTQN